ncbi:Acetyl esterase/lipase [bacterium A37T11]|nr:Acetyl esterase/lipase [bacterium A37T11]
MTLSVAGLRAQEHELIHVWPGAVPGETAPKAPHVLSADQSRNVARIGTVTDPVLQVYKPTGTINTHTGIIVCPGGGYNILASDLEGSEIASWLASLGYTAFVLEYRVPQKREGALQDLQRAIRIVRSRATAWGIQKDRVGTMGFSAGGSLTARASSFYNQQTYTPVDAADRLSAKPAFAILIYPAYLDEGPNHSITPELQINAEHPSTFIFNTADDPYGNSSLVMAGALRDAKVPVELHFYAKGGHGYGLRAGNPAAETWPSLLQQWLKNLPE